MIAFLVTNRHRYTIEGYLDWWAPELRTRIRVVPYERLASAKRFPPVTYLFSDLERLTGRLLSVAHRTRDRLHELYEQPSIVNDPRRALIRHELLHELNRAGINDYSAYRASETRSVARFPVFLREVHAHSGPLTPHLENQEELDRALRSRAIRRRGLENILIIEFCDTSNDDGIYAKYGAFVIGSHVFPRHIFFNRNWKVKSSNLVGDGQLREEKTYLETNPHSDDLRKIFEIAGIDYGRIDYGLNQGRLQVWEINTNPMVIPPRDRVKHPERVEFKLQSARKITRAFEEIDHEGIALYGRRPTDSEITALPEVRYERWRKTRHSLGAYAAVRRPYTMVRSGRAWLTRRF